MDHDRRLKERLLISESARAVQIPERHRDCCDPGAVGVSDPDEKLQTVGDCATGDARRDVERLIGDLYGSTPPRLGDRLFDIRLLASSLIRGGSAVPLLLDPLLFLIASRADGHREAFGSRGEREGQAHRRRKPRVRHRDGRLGGGGLLPGLLAGLVDHRPIVTSGGGS